MINDIEEFLEEYECPSCNNIGVEGNGSDTYICPHCHHEGSIYDELEAKNYFWDEALCGYNEDEKGEIFDNN